LVIGFVDAVVELDELLEPPELTPQAAITSKHAATEDVPFAVELRRRSGM